MPWFLLAKHKYKSRTERTLEATEATMREMRTRCISEQGTRFKSNYFMLLLQRAACWYKLNFIIILFNSNTKHNRQFKFWSILDKCYNFLTNNYQIIQQNKQLQFKKKKYYTNKTSCIESRLDLNLKKIFITRLPLTQM